MILSQDIGRQFKFDDLEEKEVIDAYQEFVEYYKPFNEGK
jgi:hypothetical protein